MRIRWWQDGEIKSGLVKEKVGQVYITRKGEHVHENGVIASDGRGGARENSGRKEKVAKKVQAYTYIDPEFKEHLEKKAKEQNIPLSLLIEERLKRSFQWKKAQDQMEVIG